MFKNRWKLSIRYSRLGFLLLLFWSQSSAARAQAIYDLHQSERSDSVTGGFVEKAELIPGEPNIRLTLNVPSFRLTLWQNEKEVKSYFVGVGLREYPIYIGEREINEIIWNPAWIPPNSVWVNERAGVRPGEIIKASDPRNPLGKMKFPLGDRYLIHEAQKISDLGNLVSHGCVRMLRSDLYDLAEKILAARSVPVSRKQVQRAQRSKRGLTVQLEQPVPVDINYDTIVVEGGVLHIYPDVYQRGLNTPARLRSELENVGLDVSALDERSAKQMFAKVTRRLHFVVSSRSIENGQALKEGRVLPLIPRNRRVPAIRKAVH